MPRIPWGSVLFYSLRIVLLGFLSVIVCWQYEEYTKEPVRTTMKRESAAFPNLTLCPYSHAKEAYFGRLLKKFAEGNIDLTELSNQTTMHLKEDIGTMTFTRFGIPEDHRFPFYRDVSGLGQWKEKFYWTISGSDSRAYHTIRCLTFFPNYTDTESKRDLVLTLPISPLFTEDRDGARASYKVYVHGTDVPIMDDLYKQETTQYALMYAGEHAYYRINSRSRKLEDLFRQPCVQSARYSKAQCEKECRWRKIAEYTQCRMPHMVHADTFLPEMAGPLDGEREMCRKTIEFERGIRRTGDVPNITKDCSGRDILPNKESLGCEDCIHVVTFEPPENSTISLSLAAFQDIHSHDCYCNVSCDHSTFTVTKLGGKIRIKETCNAVVTLKFDFTTEKSEESLVFSWDYILGNFGGMLSLVTGYSLFALTDFLASVMRKVFNALQKTDEDAADAKDEATPTYK